jgi:hypothetical protein
MAEDVAQCKVLSSSPTTITTKKERRRNTGLAARLPVTFGGRHSSLKCGVKMGIYVPFKT